MKTNPTGVVESSTGFIDGESVDIASTRHKDAVDYNMTLESPIPTAYSPRYHVHSDIAQGNDAYFRGIDLCCKRPLPL